MKGLTTGQLACKAGVNNETIRYYERQGFLVSPPRTASGYRVFPEEAVQIVRFIKRAQGLGFSLREIKELFALDSSSDSDCGDVRERARCKLEEVEAKICQLKSMRESLNRLIETCPGKGPLSDCSILESLKEE